MRNKLEKLLKANLSCSWGSYSIKKTEYAVYEVNETGLHHRDVNTSVNDSIENLISRQKLSLLLIITDVEISGNQNIQKDIESYLLDSKFNIVKKIRYDNFQISFLGAIFNDKNQLLVPNKCYNFNDNVWTKKYSDNQISCRSESDYVNQYEHINRKLLEFIKDPFKSFPWAYLKQGFDYSFKGIYYEMNESLHRSVLEITRNKKKCDDNADAVVIMMNPGSSSPEKNAIISDTSKNYPMDLVKCSPDDTQYQISHLMELCTWNKVIVLNLIDFCETDSTNVYNQFRQSIPESSIFSESRLNELEHVFNYKKQTGPVILGWGVSSDLNHIKRKALEFLERKNIDPKGWVNHNGDYYHPWPRQNEGIRRNWVNNVIRTLNDNTP